MSSAIGAPRKWEPARVDGRRFWALSVGTPSWLATPITAANGGVWAAAHPSVELGTSDPARGWMGGLATTNWRRDCLRDSRGREESQSRDTGSSLCAGFLLGDFKTSWGSGCGKARDYAPLSWQAAACAFRGRPHIPTRPFWAGWAASSLSSSLRAYLCAPRSRAAGLFLPHCESRNELEASRARVAACPVSRRTVVSDHRSSPMKDQPTSFYPVSPLLTLLALMPGIIVEICKRSRFCSLPFVRNCKPYF